MRFKEKDIEHPNIDADISEGLEGLERMPEYLLAKEFVKRVEDVLRGELTVGGDWIDQVRRASLSILLNIAEGVGKGGGSKKSFYRIARGSAFEVYAALHVSPDTIPEKVIRNLVHIVMHLDNYLFGSEGLTPSQNYLTELVSAYRWHIAREAANSD